MKTARQAARDARELWRACQADGVPDAQRARLAVARMIDANPIGLHAVLRRFVRLLRLDEAARTAVVTSATSLDAQLQTDVERDIVRLCGRPSAIQFVVDPALIGGMRVQIGSDVYDGSVRAGLAALESRF
jgi:F-type H+-transporting ATPase subunit delta